MPFLTYGVETTLTKFPPVRLQKTQKSMEMTILGVLLKYKNPYSYRN